MNDLLKSGTLNFLLDGSAGSSGKGKMSSYIVKKESVNYLVTSNTANASHTVVENGKEYVFKTLPSGSIHHSKIEKIFIVDGAAFEVKSLLKEINMTGISRHKVRISKRAAIIQDIDRDFELGLCDLNGTYYETAGDGTIKTGTTASGSGAVLAKKAIRNKTLKTVGDDAGYYGIEDMVSNNISDEILAMHDLGKTGFYEIGQGYPLSNNHPDFAPYTTSRNVIVSAALNDAFLPPRVCGNVIINFRTFPIKIHSYKYKALEDREFAYHKASYPNLNNDQYAKMMTDNHCPYHKVVKEGDVTSVLVSEGDYISWFEMNSMEHERVVSFSGKPYYDQEEIDWRDLSEYAGYPTNDSTVPKIFECTTLTKLPRRVFTFSKKNLIDAILRNDTGNEVIICVNFINYLDKELNDVENLPSLPSRVNNWISSNIKQPLESLGNDSDRISLRLLGTGAESSAMLDFKDYS